MYVKIAHWGYLRSKFIIKKSHLTASWNHLPYALITAKKKTPLLVGPIPAMAKQV